MLEGWRGWPFPELKRLSCERSNQIPNLKRLAEECGADLCTTTGAWREAVTALLPWPSEPTLSYSLSIASVTALSQP